VTAGRAADQEHARALDEARARLYDVKLDDAILGLCADLAGRFSAAGHRGDYVMALAARAAAARAGAQAVTPSHVVEVARMALQHRRMATVEGGQLDWAPADDELVAEVIGGH
jgi:magnesium chelatase subunit I